jgi:hypothetical protein
MRAFEFPNSMREIFGTSRPTQPITPQSATTDAVIAAEAPMTSARSSYRLTPSALASSSARERTLSR